MYYLPEMRKKFFWASIPAVLLAFSIDSPNSSAEDIDTILKFYVTEADSAYITSSFWNRPFRFSFQAFTYYKKLGRHGAVTRIDSTAVRYFCTGPVVDSTQILLKPKSDFPEPEFHYPNVFTKDFRHSFFPNDVGNQDLAIGFDVTTPDDALPDGIAVIDRENFELRRLYLYFPKKEGYKRLTRTYRFSEFGEHVFPDSIWEVGATEGIFSADFYRLESKIENIQLLR